MSASRRELTETEVIAKASSPSSPFALHCRELYGAPG